MLSTLFYIFKSDSSQVLQTKLAFYTENGFLCLWRFHSFMTNEILLYLLKASDLEVWSM